MAWYDTGTVSVTNGSTAVTGSGTNFVAGAQVGEGFYGPDGRLYEIQAIVSATSLTLADAYLGTTQTGQEYKIVPTQSLVADLASQVSTLISDYQSVADNAGEGKFQDGSATSPGITFTLDQDTGFFRDTANEIGVAVAGVKKAEFNSTGVDVTGTVTADGLTTGGNIFFDSTSGALRFRTDAGVEKATARLATNDLKIETSGLARTLFAANGDISFYEDTGTTPKFFWDASAERLGIGTDSPGQKLEIVGTSATALNTQFPIAAFTATSGGAAASNSGQVLIGAYYDNTDATLRRGYIQAQNPGGTASKLLLNPNGGKVGIGTDSPGQELHVQAGTGLGADIRISGNGGASSYMDLFHNSGGAGVWNASNTPLQFATNGTERMRITSTGSVGIGTSTPTHGTVEISKGSVGSHNALSFSVRDGTYNPRVILSHDTTSSSQLLKFDSSYSSVVGFADFAFMNGNVGIGTSSPSRTLSVNGAAGFGNGTIETIISFSDRGIFGTQSNHALELRTNGTERMRIDSSGNVGIGTSSPTTALTIGAASSLSTETELRLGAYSPNGLYGVGIKAHTNYSGTLNTSMSFSTNANGEAMRIDASGNLLVGTTSNAPTTTAGINLGSNNKMHATRSGGASAYFNRLTSDGGIVEFAKDGTTVGSIGTYSNDLYIGNDDVGLLFNNASNYMSPHNADTNSPSDGAMDIGAGSRRFKDIYAANALIQTSDANEKQDIAELDEAERRVAVAAKGLLRKFRWKDAVAEKGDDARIHFGIIAQDLQAAFEAEGLDAGRYGMFIHSTWTDEETGEERSRMGVRYSELLAFIIAAI